MSDRSVSVRFDAASAAYATRIVVGAHVLTADEPAAVGEGDTGPTPGELLLSALGSCTAITLRMYAQRKQWPLTGIEVAVSYGEDDKNKTVIRRDVRIEGALDATQRERLLQVANACPVHKILTGTVEIPTTLS